MITSKQQFTLDLAKQVLREKGYTYRQAGPALGVHFTHLCLVLTGKRISASLLRRISELKPREIPQSEPTDGTEGSLAERVPSDPKPSR